MDSQLTYPPKPTFVNIIAWMTLASGIVNLLWGLVAVASFWWTIVCIPFLILPTILGIFEVIYAAKLLSNPPQVVKPSTTLAILEIITILVGNVFSVVVGILALIFYNDVAVRDYFARLSGTVSPAPVAPVAPVSEVPPASVVDPVAAPEPLVQEDLPPEEEPPFPTDETPKS